MLGISLLFVGFTLFSNGVGLLRKTDPKTTGTLNLFTGSLLFILNVIGAVKAGVTADFANTAAGFLFAATYIFLGIFLLKGLDFFHIGIFGLFVSINAAVWAVLSFIAGDVFMGVLWTMWAILWGEMFFENSLKLNLKKFPAILLIAEGIFAAWIPALYLLLFV